MAHLGEEILSECRYYGVMPNELKSFSAEQLIKEVRRLLQSQHYVDTSDLETAE